MIKSLDSILEKIETKLFDNPEALKQLRVLENCHTEIDIAINKLNGIQARYDEQAQKLMDIFDLLEVRDYTLPNTFRAYERTYREVKVVDEKAFMSWLKTTLAPDEIVAFLMPPTTKAKLKKFVEKYIDDNDGEPIPGIETEVTYIKLKTDYKGLKNVKKRDEYKSYSRRKK